MQGVAGNCFELVRRAMVGALESQAAISLATFGGVKRPQLPINFFKFPAATRLKAVQQYIGCFEYRIALQPHYNVNKYRPLAKLMDTAQMMIHSPQAIKCVEGVILAIYLTAGLQGVERLPVGFETEQDTKIHQHIILVVRNGKKFGAFGMSREADLAGREIEFDSFSSIVSDYKRAYEGHRHTIQKLWVGLPVELNVESYNYVCWRYLTLTPNLQPWIECCAEMDKHFSQSKKLWERWLLEGQGEIPKNQSIYNNAKKLDINAVPRAAGAILRIPRPPSRSTILPSIVNLNDEATTPVPSRVGFHEIPSIRYFHD
ncbi:vasohibin-2 isoform X2 [Selaginella moellendorffii]|uniref:vasohibin-2 isoform X2 n=1 Tax=Selaginella moellendorffii TaxID=88036 RepID=UPI000D1C6019|nr:vasohibin-2 isoform X2 [Selaginella moellendorffii]|eukprot:XP_002961750.2 vasohibin-2 isoform X2 [Selaginella moellendorffii]